MREILVSLLAAGTPEHRGIRRATIAGAVCLLALSSAALYPVAAQDRAAGHTAGGICSFEENEVFERRPLPGHHITTKLMKPPANANAQEIKTHFIYSVILGKFARDKVYAASLRQCSFDYEVDASLDLYFELMNIGRTHNDCSLNRCAGLLSNILRTTVIDRQAFIRTIDTIAQRIRRDNSPEPRYWALGVRQATREAYRHIYASGTNAQILVSLSAEDFLNAEFDAFLAWFKERQSAFLSRKDGQRPLNDDAYCASSSDIGIQELDIDGYGWGHKAIIMVNQGFTADGSLGIGNPKLRALCPPGDGNAGILANSPWREMVGNISCSRERLNRDNWLILSSKEGSVSSAEEMRTYAHAIAQAVKADQCIHPALRIVLVNFTQAQRRLRQR